MVMLPSCSNNTGTDSCIGFDAVYVGQNDTISDAPARIIYKNNEYGRLKCGWKRSGESAFRV